MSERHPPILDPESPCSPSGSGRQIIPVWFFVGVLLLVYGIMILVSGLVEWNHPPQGVQLTGLHAPVWWGALLIVLGSVYCIIFRPGKSAN